MSYTIEYFMWGYQTHFLIGLRTAAESLFEKLDPELNPQVFMVGLLTENGPDRHPICVEPEDCVYRPERFSSVKARATELDKLDSEHQVFNSHPIAQKHHLLRIKKRALSGAVKECIQADDVERGVVSFCSGPVLVGGHDVIVVLQLSRAAFQSHYALTKSVKDRLWFQRSLIDATISEFMGLAAEGLGKPEPGSGGRAVDREADEVIRSAGKALMYVASYSGASENYSGIHGFFDACSEISSLKYEGADGKGRMFVGRIGHPNIKVDLALSTPVRIKDYRAVRKLLEMSSGGLSLLTDSALIYGLGGIKEPYDLEQEDLFTIEFRKHHDWELCHGTRRLMRVTYGQPSLPRTGVEKNTFENNVTRIFKGISGEDIGRLWTLVLDAIKQKHGTMVVISDQAKEEAARLKNQSTGIMPTRLDPELMKRVTAIDGAVLVDRDGVCHAIGVILDGLASAKGTPSRGARFNSAIRYVESQATPCLAVVVSADGTVDFIPNLRPQIQRSEVERAIATLRGLREDALFKRKIFYEVMDWLREHAFYLLPSMCEEVNHLRREVEATRDRVANSDIKIVYHDIVPNADMNEEYFI